MPVILSSMCPSLWAEWLGVTQTVFRACLQLPPVSSGSQSAHSPGRGALIFSSLLPSSWPTDKRQLPRRHLLFMPLQYLSLNALACVYMLLMCALRQDQHRQHALQQKKMSIAVYFSASSLSSLMQRQWIQHLISSSQSTLGHPFALCLSPLLYSHLYAP